MKPKKDGEHYDPSLKSIENQSVVPDSEEERYAHPHVYSQAHANVMKLIPPKTKDTNDVEESHSQRGYRSD